MKDINLNLEKGENFNNTTEKFSHIFKNMLNSGVKNENIGADLVEEQLDFYERFLFINSIKNKNQSNLLEIKALDNYENDKKAYHELIEKIKKEKTVSKEELEAKRLLTMRLFNFKDLENIDNKSKGKEKTFEEYLALSFFEKENFNIIKDEFKDEYKSFKNDLNSLQESHRNKNNSSDIESKASVIGSKLGEVFKDDKSRKVLLKTLFTGLSVASLAVNPPMFIAMYGVKKLLNTKPMKELKNKMKNKVSDFLKSTPFLEKMSENKFLQKAAVFGVLAVSVGASIVVGSQLSATVGDMIDLESIGNSLESISDSDFVNSTFKDVSSKVESFTSDFVAGEAPTEVVDKIPTEAPTEVVDKIPTEAPTEVISKIDPSFEIEDTDFDIDNHPDDQAYTKEELENLDEHKLKEIEKENALLADHEKDMLKVKEIVDNNTPAKPNDIFEELNQSVNTDNNQVNTDNNQEYQDLKEKLESNASTELDFNPDVNMEDYKIKNGDTLTGILEKLDGEAYDLQGQSLTDAVNKIAQFNGITDPNTILTGDTIKIPSDINSLQSFVENTDLKSTVTPISPDNSEILNSEIFDNNNVDKFDINCIDKSLISENSFLISDKVISGFDQEKLAGILQEHNVDKHQLVDALKGSIDSQVTNGTFPKEIVLDVGNFNRTSSIDLNISKESLLSSLESVSSDLSKTETLTEDEILASRVSLKR